MPCCCGNPSIPCLSPENGFPYPRDQTAPETSPGGGPLAYSGPSSHGSLPRTRPPVPAPRFPRPTPLRDLPRVLPRAHPRRRTRPALSRGFPWSGIPSQSRGHRLYFLAGFEDFRPSRVRGFFGGSDSRILFFQLNIPLYVPELAQPLSLFLPKPTARGAPTLVLSAAINTIGGRRPRRNPLTSRSPGRGRLLLPSLLPGARRHPPPTL